MSKSHPYDFLLTHHAPHQPVPPPPSPATMATPTQTIEWSEWHYQLFLHLMDDDCPRQLAQEVAFWIFPRNHLPVKSHMDLAIRAMRDAESFKDLNNRLCDLLK